MYKFLFLVLFSLSITVHTKGQNQVIHYYVQIDGQKSKNFSIEYGKVELTDKHIPKKIPLDHITSYNDLVKVLYTDVNRTDTENQLNVFIHGIWSHHYFEWKDVIKNLIQGVYSKSESKTVLLSIIWDSSISYYKGVRIARRKGDHLSSLMNFLIEEKGQNKLSFLCHSMGNRIFEHAIKASNYTKSDSFVIDHLVSAGADLESQIFNEGEPLSFLPKIVEDISVYVHNNDRSLKMSQLANKSERLGLHGINLHDSKPSNIRTIDVSTILYFEDLGSSLSNHRYFYKSQWIMSDMKKVIWEKDFETNKVQLRLKNQLKLLEEEKKSR